MLKSITIELNLPECPSVTTIQFFESSRVSYFSTVTFHFSLAPFESQKILIVVQNYIRAAQPILPAGLSRLKM